MDFDFRGVFAGLLVGGIVIGVALVLGASWLVHHVSIALT
jgi:hypothetical protein